MNARTHLLYAALALSAALIVSGCGEKNASVKSTRTSKPAVQAKSGEKPLASNPAAPAASLPGLDSSKGIGDVLNPLASNPLPLASGAPGASAKPGPLPVLGGKPAPAPVKPIPPNVRPEPKQLLAIVQQVYRGAVSMKVEGVSSTTVKLDGKKATKDNAEKFTTVYKRPDKFIMTSPGSSITCDGKNVTVYSSQAKRYQKMPFGKEFAQSLVYGKPGVGMMGLVFGMDYTTGVSSYKLLKDSKVSGQDTFVLQLKFKKNVGPMPNADVTQTLWIGKRDLSIYKNQVLAIEKPTKPKGFTGKFPKLVETTVVATVSKYTLNPKLSDSAFAFKAPSGAKAVEKPKEVNLIGKSAPDFTFTDSDGSRKKLSDLKGKPVLLVFWALPMPEDEVKALQSAFTAHKDDTQVVAINLNQEQAKVKEFLKSKGYSMPLTFADESIAKVVMEEYAIRGVPSVLMIDKSGTVRLATLGIPKGEDMSAKLAKYTPSN